MAKKKLSEVNAVNDIEKEIRSRLQYLLEDESRYEAETNVPETVGEMLDRQLIPEWVDHEVESKMLEYIEEHPKATVWELDDFETSLLPPLEIVDDDELEDDE